MARIESSAARFRIAAQGTLRQIRQRIVDTAKRESAKVLSGDPKPSSYQRYVDGVKGVAEESVKPFGIIVYEFSYIAEVVEFALEALGKVSPVDSGSYLESHNVFLNGVQLAEIGFVASDLKNWKPGDHVSIINYVPYARKIEVGKMKMKIPGTDHVYRQAEQIVRRRFGNLARIKFTFVGISDGGVVRGKPGNPSFMRFPALIIQER